MLDQWQYLSITLQKFIRNWFYAGGSSCANRCHNSTIVKSEPGNKVWAALQFEGFTKSMKRRASFTGSQTAVVRLHQSDITASSSQQCYGTVDAVRFKHKNFVTSAVWRVSRRLRERHLRSRRPGKGPELILAHIERDFSLLARLPWIDHEWMEGRSLFRRDQNARPHTAANAQADLAWVGIPVMEWPACSANLILIESLLAKRSRQDSCC